MSIKKFSKFVRENAAPAQDYVVGKGSDKDTLEPRAKGEKDFANMHTVSKTDYTPVPGQNHVFDGTIQKEETEYTEEDEDSELSEGSVWDAIQNIKKTKGAKKVKFDNGSTQLIDMQTANAMVQVYNKVNDQNKKKMIDAIQKSPSAIIKLMDLAFGGKK
jgi:hypothetical protein